MSASARVAAGAICCRVVADPDERGEHHRIRHVVFVVEQRIFAGSDADDRDARADVLHVLGRCGPAPAGTVRLYPLDAATGLWQGDRLAVLPRFRTSGIGAPLVRFAVATAAARGGRRMLAHVQVANQRFFERLGWSRHGEVEDYVGRPHVLMSIDLSSPDAAELQPATGDEGVAQLDG